MTVPPDVPPDGEPPLDFDPYRFGKPDHPVSPDWAPPGYHPVAPPVGPAGPYPNPRWPPPPPPGYGPHGTATPNNTKATLALVFGILAVVFFWLTIADLVFIVPAIVLGILGRNDARRFPERGGRGAATSGLVCGLVAVVLTVAALVYVYHRIRPCLDEYDIGSNAGESCVSHRLGGNG